jgi:hypothetical protein
LIYLLFKKEYRNLKLTETTISGLSQYCKKRKERNEGRRKEGRKK